MPQQPAVQPGCSERIARYACGTGCAIETGSGLRRNSVVAELNGYRMLRFGLGQRK
jgi:hypothetical protein